MSAIRMQMGQIRGPLLRPSWADCRLPEGAGRWRHVRPPKPQQESALAGAALRRQIMIDAPDTSKEMRAKTRAANNKCLLAQHR